MAYSALSNALRSGGGADDPSTTPLLFFSSAEAIRFVTPSF
jgi:hypothetical protein